MEEIKVSIIVPVYNCEKHLNRCIKSILEQTYMNIELLLINDGSQDESLNVCNKFKNLDKRVKVFNQDNSGASVARNVGIENSTGEYLMFVDADDYIEKGMLKALVNNVKSVNADFIMCGMTIDVYNSEGKLISSKECNLKPRTIVGNINIPLNILDLVENEKISGPCCKLIRTEIIKKNKIKMPPHISLQEDLYFNIKVLEHVNIMTVIEGCYYHYIKGIGESVTSRYFPNKYHMTNEVHDLLLEYYKKRCDNPDILNRVKYLYIKNTFAGVINLFHKNCDLTKGEKLKYINNIIGSRKYSEMVFSASKSGLKYKILKILLRTKSKLIIYYSSKLFNLMKYSFGFRY